jgi:UDP:flavonoid glycosyltransferase YjiC (YdhE family)
MLSIQRNYPVAGIPTIIRPFFGDQFFWADRVEALGVGTGVRRLTVDTLKDALTIATTDRKQIDRARMVGEQIRRVRSCHGIPYLLDEALGGRCEHSH